MHDNVKFINFSFAKDLHEGCASVINVAPSESLPQKALVISSLVNLLVSTAFKNVFPPRSTAVTTWITVIYLFILRLKSDPLFLGSLSIILFPFFLIEISNSSLSTSPERCSGVNLPNELNILCRQLNAV